MVVPVHASEQSDTDVDSIACGGGRILTPRRRPRPLRSSAFRFRQLLNPNSPNVWVDARRKSGFTMLELMVTLIIIGLIGGVTAMATAPQLRQARLTAILDQIDRGDQAERSIARRSPFPGSVEVDFAKELIRFSQSARSVKLPTGWSVAEARSTLAGRLRSGNESISRFASNGQSASYAIQVEHDSTGIRKWILFLGLSGQSIRCEDNALIDDTFGSAIRR